MSGNTTPIVIGSDHGAYDLKEKIKVWENFYNFNRPHKSHGGLTPYEVFRAKMNIEIQGQP